MINLFALCKNDLFFKIIEPLLNQQEIFITDTCKLPNSAVSKFSLCHPQPDIILLDANWYNHGFSGAELLKTFLNYTDTPPKIIIVTNCYEPTIINRLKELGANGYFYRAADNVDTIFDCIKKVYSGKNYFAAKA